MHKFFSALFLFFAGIFHAHAQTSSGVVTCVPTPTTYTANLNLTKPGHCATNYDVLNNADFDLLDSIVSGGTAIPWSFTSSQVINIRNASRTVTASIDPSNGNFVVHGLTLAADPTAALQAATKQYVDAQVAAFSSSVSVDQVSSSCLRQKLPRARRREPNRSCRK